MLAPAVNFLAHFLLSGTDDELRLGNLLGDVVKGRVAHYDHPGVTERMRTGIRLHRAIDSFSDAHPVVRRSKQRIAGRYGRLSGVIVDIYYDHVLAREWATHGEGTLAEFAADVYRTLREHLDRLPVGVHPLVHAMTRGNWLAGYAQITHIDRALRGMARRSRVAVGIGTAAEELARDYDAVAEDFAEFFPELRAHCVSFLAATHE
ncbi:Acyl carrier protein phosphodiesterase [Luteitalea pratensis]|uniref:Acyl carrier protein phosphodiesterase n=1 Tax=Luteitalea pratensis TaxID=1855912 RepID=A0A143PLC1_LUTPR|nr:ACP phosphodiesterase [Luteitalea pratensis]AMY08569.1 Acyl carrier protein phosphodiesterase [Luteitalea pratensis]